MGSNHTPSDTPRPRRLLRDWRLWAAAAVALYTLVGFLVVPLVAKRQIVAGVKKTLACDASIAGVRFNPYTFNANLEQLAAARSAAIRGYLVEMQTIPAARVEILEREIHDDGGEWIRCKLSLEGMD